MKSKRVDSVDLLRGLSMMGLVLVHSVLYLTAPPDDVDLVYTVFALGLGDLGAALFTTLVGISFVLSMRSRRGTPERQVLLSAAVRGLFLVAVAMVASLLTTGIETVFEWDVLVLIGIASAVLPLVRRWPSPVLLAVAAAIVVLAPVVRGLFDYVVSWGGSLEVAEGIPPAGLLMRPVGEYVPGLDPMVALTGLMAGAWFPALPWLAFPVAGIVLGRQLSADRVRVSRRWILLGVTGLAVGLGLALAALRRGHANPVTDYLSVFSPTPRLDVDGGVPGRTGDGAAGRHPLGGRRADATATTDARMMAVRPPGNPTGACGEALSTSPGLAVVHCGPTR